MKIHFLSVDEIIILHHYQIIKHEGMQGIRDKHLLESAVHMPQASFGGTYLHTTLFEMAAVYGHGLIKNHPFCDGNKRTGMASMIIFLDRNGYEAQFSEEKVCELGVAIATSQLSIEEIAQVLKKHSKAKKS